MIARIGIMDSVRGGRARPTLITDGVDDYAVIPNSVANNLVDNISIYLRIKFAGAANAVVLAKSTDNSHYHVSSSVATFPVGALVFGLRGVTGSRINTPAINDGSWHDVLFWQNGSTIGGYCDSTTLTPKTVVSMPIANVLDWHFGSRYGSFAFPGEFEYRLYSGQKTLAEFNQLKAGEDVTAGLINSFASGVNLFNGATLITY